MREPFLEVLWQGRDLVQQWGPILISCSVTDEKGLENDKLTIELDDEGGVTEAPEPGETVFVRGGYLDHDVYVEAEFEIDTIDLEGWPQKIVLNGSSASAKKGNKERKNEAHKKSETPTFGKLVEKIAKRNGWKPAIAADLAKIDLAYEAQSAESDLSFLGRICERYGAIAAVKQGRLIVNPRASGKTASGAEMSGLLIAYGDNLKSYKVSRKKKPEHKQVEASVFDRKKVKRVDVKAGSSGGDASITYRFREPFRNEDEAKRAAEAKLSDFARAGGSATFTLTGEPGAMAEQPVLVEGVRPTVDGEWNATRVEHKWSDSGYETVVECELPGSGGDNKKNGGKS